jgi:hypothetical protein
MRTERANQFGPAGFPVGGADYVDLKCGEQSLG